MAEYALIEGYLETLRARLRWHRDVEDLVAEAQDHLYSALERLEAEGAEVQLAQRRALEDFGELDLMAETFGATPHGGLAIPTKLTASGGTLAIVCAVLWLTVVSMWWLAGAIAPRGEIDPNASAVSYVVGWAALIGACVLMVFIMRALDQRHGGLGVPGRAGLLLAILSAVASIAGWVYGGWAVPLLVGTLVFGTAMLQRGITPRLPTLAFGGGFALGGITWIAGRVLRPAHAEWAGVGFWGESWVPNSVSLSAGAGMLALGLLGLGRWLRAEEPVDLDASDRVLHA